ncbi:o-methyltransferase [Aspergillus sclerotialis]|uniref:O-methyltransferase n=1 Tax=Aspergillus sclerotialis TaxID=2070753 RepID=A0A3A2ZAR1_9EURO|nr:o-methyltransferase [Aspergillus sclerotialis]
MVRNSSKTSHSSERHSLADLGLVVASSAAIVDNELGKKELPPLDDERFPVSFPLLSPEGSHARLELIYAALNIIRLASGPADYLANLTLQGFELGTISTVIRLHVLEYIPIGGTASFEELSSKTGIEKQLLTRLIRYSISAGFLSEQPPGHVRHNSVSSACLRDPNTHDHNLWNINCATPASLKLFESLQLDPTGTDGAKTGFSIAMAGPGKPLGTIWDYHANHPDVARQFQNYMASMPSMYVYDSRHLTQGFDWTQVKTIVDMGGSGGHFSMAIYDSYPHVKAAVQDIGDTVTTARAKLPPKYHKAITIEEHDFFQPQKTVADCYILRFILHNWSDDKVRDIIRNLTPALRPGVWVLVMDHVLPTEAHSVHPLTERIIRNMDITMLGLMAGRERTEEDYKRLLQGVDPRLELRSSICPVGSALTLLEFQVIGSSDNC